MSADNTPTTPPAQIMPSRSRRVLRREGAFILSSAEQALADAMLQSSSPPHSVLGRRSRHEGNDTDTEPDTVEPHALPEISNVSAAVMRYATKKKLRPEQRDDLDSFLTDTALGRTAKVFVNLLVLENKLDTIHSAAPAYQLSEELKTNINNYCVAVMLSVNISAYKGNIPRNHVLDILKRYRFDLPPGIEHDYANWEKISTYVGYSLTQCRARLKKLIKESISANMNIFSLAQLIVHSTPCRTTVQLCARVALMRAVHVECAGSEKYWNLIDARLEFIRSTAESSAKKIAKAFNGILKLDRETYGTGEEYEIGDTVADEMQQRVDDAILGLPVE